MTDRIETKDEGHQWTHLMFKSLPGYPWLDPCPRCGFLESCDCTVLERARAAHPGLVFHAGGTVQ
jgi:hypothetical protein